MRSILLFVTALFFLLGLALSFIPLGDIGKIDFSQYYSASTVFLQGENPYDPQYLHQVEMQIRGSKAELIRMWNPPLIFPLILPLTLLSFDTAAILWLALGISLSVAAALFTCQLIASQQNHKAQRLVPLITLFTISYLPLIDSAQWGQISPILLCALTASLLFTYDSSKRNAFLSGASLALTLIKPHLLYLYYLYLVFALAREERLRFAFGFISVALVLAVISFFIQPQIFSWYLAIPDGAPIYWKTPTLGTYFQAFTNIHTLLMRSLPTLITALIMGLIYLRSKFFPANLPTALLIIPLSLLTSPYGWLYDQLLLIPSVLWLLMLQSARYSKLIISILLLLQVAMLLIPALPQNAYWFNTATVLILISLARKQESIN